MADVEHQQSEISTLTDSLIDVFIGLGMPCFELNDIAAVASVSKEYLQMAIHDSHWKPRLLCRRWDLTPCGLTGCAAVQLWCQLDDLDTLSDARLHLQWRLRGRSKRSKDTAGLARKTLQSALTDAVKDDMPVRPWDGAGWWRQLYRALLWGQVLRQGVLVEDAMYSSGAVERLFVGRSVHNEHAGHGWNMRFLELDAVGPSLTIFTWSMVQLAEVDLSQIPLQAGELHGQSVEVPMHRAALRWPEDVRSTDGSPLEAWRAVSHHGGRHQWSFTVAGLGVDLLLRTPTPGQRDLWIERINAAALQGRGQVELRALGRLAGLEALNPGGSEWQRVGMPEAERLKGLMARLDIGLESVGHPFIN
mmetsp:Transcript_31997/g.91832  ORF Transcript_31997/g.91832 Transcript_31997/m.91832 type:complete len:362 (+) Transcript_31997:62-1147(+)